MRVSEPVVSSWSVLLEDSPAPAGTLQLRRATGGLYWCWPDKPQHLVPIVGVLDPYSPAGSKPRGFAEIDCALFHLMDCVGFAFRGRCSLIQQHP